MPKSRCPAAAEMRPAVTGQGGWGPEPAAGAQITSHHDHPWNALIPLGLVAEKKWVVCSSTAVILPAVCRWKWSEFEGQWRGTSPTRTCRDQRPGLVLAGLRIAEATPEQRGDQQPGRHPGSAAWLSF